MPWQVTLRCSRDRTMSKRLGESSIPVLKARHRSTSMSRIHGARRRLNKMLFLPADGISRKAEEQEDFRLVGQSE